MMHSEQAKAVESDHEGLSDLLDGELDEIEGRRAVGRLVRDPALARRWSEYCLIGDVLRGHGVVQRDWRARFRAALEAEPTVLAPMKRRDSVRPVFWAAAAAAVAGVTWTVWTALLTDTASVQIAAGPQAPVVQASQMTPYLDAHQDFAHGVMGHPEMQFTNVTLASVEGGR